MKSEETTRCPFCVKGEWYKDPDWKEPYGYPYTPPKIACGICQGTCAILKKEIKNHPNQKQISEEQREIILKKMEEVKHE